MADSIFITNPELSVSETAGTVYESISRTGSLVGDVTVTYGITGDTATAGQDFIGGTGTITIPSGVSQVTVPIQILDDTLAEPTETFAFSLLSDVGGTIWAPRTSRISILDNENPAPPPNPEPPLTSNYNVTQTPLVTGLDQPVRMVFSPVDPTQAYVAEKPGVIALVDVATGTSTTVLDLSAQVNDSGDRGLLDIALHPDFVHNPYIYAFMVVDPPDSAGQTGQAGPDGTGNRYSQVVRYTADASTNYTTIVPGSGVVLLGGAGQSLGDISGGGAQDFSDPTYINAPASDQYINPNAATPPDVINGFKQNYLKDDSSTHAGGHLSFGPDGSLYVSVGDGSAFDFADPRAPNVQSLDSLSGKILRVDPMTGLGMSDNPFVTAGVSLDSNRAKLFQLGYRNPFSVTFAPDGRLFVADTGWYSWEEIDTGGPGSNFGWPYYEGGDGGVSIKAPTYQDMPAATAFYNAVAAGSASVTAPFRGFSHDPADPGFQLQAITAGEAIYTGSVYPNSLQNDFIFADFAGGKVYAVNVNDSSDVKFLYAPTGFYPPTDFVQGADGYIYYSDLVYGTIGRLDITAASSPVASPLTTTIGSGPDGLVLKISEDAYLGDAQYTISVDGVQIGGTLSAAALHGSGLDDTVTVLGNWAPGTHTLTVNFLNDAWGGGANADRNLYVDGVSHNGVALPDGTAALLWSVPQDFSFTDTGTAATTTIGSGPDSLVLKISEYAYLGDAQYTISVDGTQIGGTLTAAALHGSGLDDTVTVHGIWAAGAHTLTVQFINDAWGGTPQTDRNLYVDGVSFNGAAVPGGTAVLLGTVPQDFGFTSSDTTIGSGPDSLVLKISEDAYLGDAQYTISVDGVLIGGTLTASALHGAGFDNTVTVQGNWAPGPHTLTVNFLNDAWGGTATTDRNLYVDGVSYNGIAVAGATSAMLNNGAQNFGFIDGGSAANTTIGSGSDSLVLKISEDAYLGNAQYIVSVDGTQIGGTLTASALHGSGLDDTVTVQGNWAAGSHRLTVQFLNDAWGGSADTDRNLYVDGVSYNGAAVPGGSAVLLGSVPQDFAFTDTGSSGTTVTIAAGDANPVVNLDHVTIVATAGDHMLFIGGSFDTATLTGGVEGVQAFQGNNTITTGAADDALRIGGSGNVVDAGGGTNRIDDSGSGNTIVMAGPGSGFDDVYGYVMQNSDVLDFRTALAGTAWDGSSATLGNFMQVTMSGGDAIVALRATAGGAFSNVADLHGTGDLDLPGLLAHAVT